MSANTEQKSPQKVNVDEVNEATGFKRAEEYVWNAFEATHLHGGSDAGDDVDAWVDGFCEQAEQDGLSLERNFVKFVCTLGMYAGPRDEFQQRSGSGKAVYPNGDRYDGEFFEGKKHGSGLYIFSSKVKSEVDKLVEGEVTRNYAGEIKNLDETATKKIAEKFQISQHVVANIVENGYYPFYQGDYIRGRRTGQGVMKNKDATVYKGEFLDNKREGQGVFYYINGDVFSGSWRAGQKHGYGTYRFSGGGEYRGEWVDGNFTQGQWILSDGTYYEGKFDKKNRPQDDCATMHYPHIHMAQHGVFRRGVWAPTSALEACGETPVDGMAWAD